MLRFLDIKYLVVLVAASLVAIVCIQVTGVGPALEANAPLVRYWAQHRQRADGPEFEPIRRNVGEATANTLGEMVPPLKADDGGDAGYRTSAGGSSPRGLGMIRTFPPAPGITRIFPARISRRISSWTSGRSE